MSEIDDLKSKLADADSELDLALRDFHKWENEAKDKLRETWDDPTKSQEEKDKALYEFRSERREKIAPLDQLPRNRDSIKKDLDAAIENQKKNPETKSEDVLKDPTKSPKEKEKARKDFADKAKGSVSDVKTITSASGSRGEGGKSGSTGRSDMPAGSNLNGKKGGEGKKGEAAKGKSKQSNFYEKNKTNRAS